MHAHAAESLLPYLTPGARILDIGSGSGYLTHVLAELVFSSPTSATPAPSSRAKVVGLEHISALRNMGERNMRKSEDGKRFLEDGKVQFVKGDGRKGFVDPSASGSGAQMWDAIHVGAAAVRVHEDLITQLKSPGR